jgi:SAM-dependent methyltransferase
VRAPLARWLREEAGRAYADLGRYRVLDVGCGQKPYEPFFTPQAAAYVGVDAVENPKADLRGPVEALPVEDGSFDLVLCNQVLEHADDPALAVRELFRALAPGGRLLLSTHGTQVYHPSPVDYWRWTHAGLEKILRDNAEWASVTVVPASGTTACIAMLLNVYIDLAARRAHLGALAKPLVAGLNAAAEAIDRRSAALREPRPGTLFANLHAVAEKAR